MTLLSETGRAPMIEEGRKAFLLIISSGFDFCLRKAALLTLVGVL